MRTRYKPNEDLDLHGMRHYEVAEKVEDFILVHQPPFKIITGNSDDMKAITTAVLERHGYKYNTWLDNPGVITVVSE